MMADAAPPSFKPWHPSVIPSKGTVTLKHAELALGPGTWDDIAIKNMQVKLQKMRDAINSLAKDAIKMMQFNHCKDELLMEVEEYSDISKVRPAKREIIEACVRA